MDSDGCICRSYYERTGKHVEECPCYKKPKSVVGLSEKEQQTYSNRSNRYGEFTPMHKNLGLMWTAILQSYYKIELSEPIPSDIVLLMMVLSKTNRAGAEPLQQPDDDNYVDGSIYLKLAKDAKQERRNESGEKKS